MSDYYDDVMKNAEEMEQPWREKQLADAGRSLAAEVKQLRELNAELLCILKGVTDQLASIGFSELSMGLVALARATINKAEGKGNGDVDLKEAIAKAEKLRS